MRFEGRNYYIINANDDPIINSHPHHHPSHNIRLWLNCWDWILHTIHCLHVFFFLRANGISISLVQEVMQWSSTWRCRYRWMICEGTSKYVTKVFGAFLYYFLVCCDSIISWEKEGRCVRAEERVLSLAWWMGGWMDGMLNDVMLEREIKLILMSICPVESLTKFP